MPSGVIIGWRDDSLIMTHGSDVSESATFDAEYNDNMTPDPRLRQVYVMLHIRGDEETPASIALPTLANVTEVFGVALMPIGPIGDAGVPQNDNADE